MIHPPHHLHLHQNHQLHHQTKIIQIQEMIPVILQVIPAYQAMTVEANIKSPRKEQKNLNQNQRQQRDTDTTPNYSTNYAEQQRTID